MFQRSARRLSLWALLLGLCLAAVLALNLISLLRYAFVDSHRVLSLSVGATVSGADTSVDANEAAAAAEALTQTPSTLRQLQERFVPREEQVLDDRHDEHEGHGEEKETERERREHDLEEEEKDEVFDEEHGHMHQVTASNSTFSQSLAARRSASLATCLAWKSDYSIQSGSSWGSANVSIQHQWSENECDALLALENYDQYVRDHPELLAPLTVPESRRTPVPWLALFPDLETENAAIAPLRAHSLANPRLPPVIAICVCTTTRGLHVRELSALALFSTLFPSIVATAEPGFLYAVYLLYDAGDQFFDNDANRQRVHEYALSSFTAPLHQRGIFARVYLERFENRLRKPGPAFNFLTHLAYIDGADYIYRINDDTIFITENWASVMTKAVLALATVGTDASAQSPSKVALYGVVGPLCREGNTAILTHDFVHRQHHEIFLTYHYPPSLSDWWMDDWISRVYGSHRTKLLHNIVVKHAVNSHGTRYAVDFSHAPLLGAEIEIGRGKVESWLASQKLTVELDDYRHDSFHFHLKSR